MGKEEEEMKRFLIIFTVAVIVIILSCIFLREWDGVYYIIWETWAVVGVAAKVEKDRLDR